MATTGSGSAPQVPARYRGELNAAAIGLAMKITITYCVMMKKTVSKQKLNWHVLVLVWVEVWVIQPNCMQRVIRQQ